MGEHGVAHLNLVSMRNSGERTLDAVRAARLKRAGAILAALLALCSTGFAATTAKDDADAIVLNNRGVALMGQQFTDKAATAFTEAFAKDPHMAQAAINKGIALMSDYVAEIREIVGMDVPLAAEADWGMLTFSRVGLSGPMLNAGVR